MKTQLFLLFLFLSVAGNMYGYTPFGDESYQPFGDELLISEYNYITEYTPFREDVGISALSSNPNDGDEPDIGLRQPAGDIPLLFTVLFIIMYRIYSKHSRIRKANKFLKSESL